MYHYFYIVDNSLYYYINFTFSCCFSGRLTAMQCKEHAWFLKMFSESTPTTTIPTQVPCITPSKPRTPIPLKRTVLPEEKPQPEIFTSTPIQKETRTETEKRVLNDSDKINNNDLMKASRGLSEERKRSLRTNLASLVERLDNEDVSSRTARIQRNDSLKRASAMQTMPSMRYRSINNSDLEQTVFKFKRVVLVDEDEGIGASPVSSTDNSSISDSGSDTISEMSIDSSSDRSSIISLDEGIDLHCSKGMMRHYSSCVNVWEASRSHRPLLRPVPKECNESFARAMSKFQTSEETEQTKVRLRSVEERNRFHLFNTNRLSLPQPNPGRKTIGLEFIRERNGNLVVIREVKAVQGKKYSRTSELKCESVQSRIRKLQQINSDQLDNSIF